MTDIAELLHESDALATELSAFLELPPYDNSPRIISSRALCGVSFEHSESVRVLIRTGNFTSSLGVLRMQYEALVKAIWALYAASENSIFKLQSSLNSKTANWADKIPLLGDVAIPRALRSAGTRSQILEIRLVVITVSVARSRIVQRLFVPGIAPAS